MISPEPLTSVYVRVEELTYQGRLQDGVPLRTQPRRYVHFRRSSSFLGLRTRCRTLKRLLASQISGVGSLYATFPDIDMLWEACVLIGEDLNLNDKVEDRLVRDRGCEHSTLSYHGQLRPSCGYRNVLRVSIQSQRYRLKLSWLCEGLRC